MAATIVSSFLNALTTQGQIDIWSNGFGLTAPIADTAAMILGPEDLLTGPILPSLTLADLDLDDDSATSVVGLYQVALATDTGFVVASLSVSLNVTATTQPVGVALYHEASEHLWYITAFSPWPTPLPGVFTWNIKIPLSQCLTSG